MKKFSITKLEAARTNPTDFAKNLKATADGAQQGWPSQYSCLKDAINEFHKQNDLSKSINYLEKRFNRFADNPKNKKQLTNYINSLDFYIKSVKKNELGFLKKETIEIILNSKSKMTGQIPLTFMNNKGGFSIYFFSKLTDGWENELKYPIIQNHFAELYGTDLDKIEVGIFSTEHNKFFEQSFSDLEVDTANKELEKIGKIIFDIL